MKFSFFAKSPSSETKQSTTSTPIVSEEVIDQAIDDLLTSEELQDLEYLSKVVEKSVPKKVKPRFRIIKEVNGSKFMLDEVNGLSRINWSGSVTKETASVLLELGGDSVEFQGYRKLILDRRGLKEFDTEARIWMKGFIKGRAKNIVGKVERLAMVNRQTGSGSIFANFIGSAIKMVMPNLKIKKFTDIHDALDWTMEE
ncbi:MAG: hypothetical protein R8G66_14810 [Cytophagales bacterium]|nr:hypothetical protein [Cytophagales bacterium]